MSITGDAPGLERLMGWRIAILFLLFYPGQVAAQFGPLNLRCEERISPMGIETPKPRFSWWIAAEERGFVQTACQVQVASSREKLNEGDPDLWDSGKVVDGENSLFAYGGKPLAPAAKYYWKVRIWDQQGRVSDWSGPAAFSTGLQGEDAWAGANWIAFEKLPDSMKVVPGVHGGGGHLGDKAVKRAVIPFFRKSFVLEKQVKEAFVFVSGLGQYELRLNGEKVGKDFLTPGWTDYTDRCLYNAYDVTGQLRKGENALGAIVGTGFFYINRERYRKLVVAYGYPMLRLKLVLRFADGSVREIVTDQSWETAPSPIVYSSIYGGESYNANLEQPGWDQPGRNQPGSGQPGSGQPGLASDGWRPALTVDGPGGAMKAQIAYPLRVMDTIATEMVSEPLPGKRVFDFGQNASGIIRLKVTGRKGDTIRIWPGELLDENGIPTQQASGGPYYFEYILNGEGTEEWEPRFTYYGFRYALVEGPAKSVSLQLLHTRSSAPETGAFFCSNPLFNQIHELIDWAIRSNLTSVTTDCPHREKLGWLEQAHLMGGSIQYRYQILQLYNKVVNDMIEAQLPNGLVPDIAPEYVVFEGGFRDSPEWGSASILLPWYLYHWYGDEEVLFRAYGMMTRYLDYLETKARNHILSHGLGDWYDLGPEPPGPSQLTPISLTATAMYYYDANVLSKVATVVGKAADAARYRRLARQIKNAFNREFFDRRNGVYATGSQTSYAMPLFVGLTDEADRGRVLDNLVDSIITNGKNLTAGDIGYHYLVRVLEEGGKSQLLYEMNNRDDVPGYGYQIALGATALTESWPALKYVSNNHMMLGHLMEWFYSGLAGIGQADGSNGYRKFRIAPQLVEGIDHAEAGFKAISGPVNVRWEKTRGGFNLEASVPPNTEAVIHLPVSSPDQVLESGKPLKDNPWLKSAAWKDGKLVLTVASGNYSFSAIPAPALKSVDPTEK